MIELLVDENLSHHFAKGLHELQYPLGDDVVITSMEDAFGRGAPDELWIPDWGKRNGIFLTQDIRITTRQHQAALLAEYKVGAFFLDPPKGYRYWDRVKMVIRHWEEMVDLMKNQKRPFAYLITPRRINRLKIG